MPTSGTLFLGGTFGNKYRSIHVAGNSKDIDFMHRIFIFIFKFRDRELFTVNLPFHEEKSYVISSGVIKIYNK